jgi:hypothetical protein
MLDFPTGDNCADCVRRWNDIKQQAKVELWKSLPGIFGMEPWAEASSRVAGVPNHQSDCLFFRSSSGNTDNGVEV